MSHVVAGGGFEWRRYEAQKLEVVQLLPWLGDGSRSFRSFSASLHNRMILLCDF